MQILNELGIEYNIIDYISNPLGIDELKVLSIKLDLRPCEFIRSREKDFKDNGLAEFLDNDEILFEYMSKYPKLIERPIIQNENKAIIGRPVEKVRKFFNKDLL